MASSPVDRRPASVRWIEGAAGWMRANRGRALAVVLGLIALGLMSQGVFTVENGESAAVLRFGRLVDDAVPSGMHFRLPAGIDQISKARTGEVFRLEVEGDFVPEVALLSGDENLIDAALVVQYRISRLGEYLFATESPEVVIGQVVRAALLETFAGFGVDELLTSAKAATQTRVRQQAQERLDRYGAGVTLVAINLQSVNPPFEAAGAFRAVSDARAEAAQLVSQAQGEREKSVRIARGEAGRLLHQVEAESEARGAQAQGSADRFEHLLARRRQSPGLTAVELRTATIREIMPRARLIILAPGEAPRIDVQLISNRVDDDSLPPSVLEEP